MVPSGKCSYKYVRYGDLPVVKVQRFWTNHVETCVGVITPNFCRQMLCTHSLSLYLSFSLYDVFFNKRVKLDSTATLRKAVNHSKPEATNTLVSPSKICFGLR